MKTRRMKQLALILAAVMLWAASAAAFAGGETVFAAVTGTSFCNVRSGAGVEYPIVGSVQRGGWVSVLQETGGWYYVRTQAGQLGYMSASLLKKAVGTGGGSGRAVVHNPIATQYLNLRQYPAWDAPVLGIYYNGTEVTILSQHEGWYYVWVNGQQGYFRQEYIRVTGGASGGQAGRVYAANGKRVNLRSGPAAGYPSMGLYFSGASLTVLVRGNPYHYVSIGGQTGFMDRSFVRIGSSPDVPAPHDPWPTPPSQNVQAMVTHTGHSLNLRERPDTRSRVLGSFFGGTQLVVHSYGTQWCRVTLNGLRGYMMTRYLTFFGPVSPVRRVAHPNHTFVYLRTGPSQKTGAVQLRVPHGSHVTVIAPNGTWAKVNYNGKVGYMMSWFLK